MTSMPQSRTTPRPDSPERFTLAQALVVFVAAGVLSHAAARWVVQPLRDEIEASQRQQLQGRADAALQRLGSDLRTSTPLEARVGESGLRLEIRRVQAQPVALGLGLHRVAYDLSADEARRAEWLVYRCNLADGTLTRQTSRLDRDDSAAAQAVVHGVTACRFSQQQDDRIELTLTLSAPLSASRTTVTRQHALLVGNGV